MSYGSVVCFMLLRLRLAKEKVSYEQEADQQQQKIDNMKAAGEDEYVIKKQVSNRDSGEE